MKKYITTLLALVVCSGIYAAPKPPMSPLTVQCLGGGSSPASITLSIGAGATGAPAGFSIMWMKQSDLDALGGVWPSDTTMFCEASYSGVPGCSGFNIPPNGSVQVTISDDLPDLCGISSTCAMPLECATAYAFRLFAHANSNNSKGPFTIGGPCSTGPCGSDSGCTLTQGYWKNHLDAWPVNSLTLGTVNYDQGSLSLIFSQQVSGNGLVSLAHQLIAAKLNIAKGADGSALGTAIADADTLIGNLVVPPVGAGSLSPGSTSALTTALDNWNMGITGPGHCPSEQP